MSECTHDCSTCTSDCGSRQEPEDLIEKLNEDSTVRHVYAVMSGKGGVGKSLVTSALAVKTREKGFRVGILDADITGPSIPKAFGLKGTVGMTEKQTMIPMTSAMGIDVISTNLLLPNETDPVVWRGPIIAGVVKQFWTDTFWDNIDYMYVDMPPGTGDVPLTVFQSLPVEGIIVVTSPQDLVSMVVEKAVRMADMMSLPIIGIIENYSYFECPDNGRKYEIFGTSHVDEVAEKYGIPVLAKLPIDPALAKAVDEGLIEYAKLPDMEQAISALVSEH